MGHAYHPKSDVSLRKNHHLTGIGNRQGGVNHHLLQWGASSGYPVHFGCGMGEDRELEVQCGHLSDDASTQTQTWMFLSSQ